MEGRIEELIGGEIVAKPKGSSTHDAIVATFSRLLASRCQVRGALVERQCFVKIDENRFCPDLVVLGTGPQPSYVPVVVVEVVSPLTRALDYGPKLNSYLTLLSIEAIVYVEQDIAQVTVWDLTTSEPSTLGLGDRLELPCIDFFAQVSELYADSQWFE